MRLRAAARLVERMGPAASASLAEAIAAERDPALLAALVEELGKCGAAEALPLARSLQDHPEVEVRCAAASAAMALARCEADRRAVAERAIADGDPRVRRRAALEIAALRGFEGGPLLVSLLEDEDRHARRLACIGLGSTRDPEAALALVGSLVDPDEEVRLSAGASLERLFGGRAEGLARLSAQGRARAVPRLRAWIRGRLGTLAPEGKLLPPPSREETSAAERHVSDSDVSNRNEGVPADIVSLPEADVAPGSRAAKATEAEPPEAVPQAMQAAPASASAAASGTIEEALALRVEAALRAALRGATFEDLLREAGEPEERLSSTLEALLAAGRIRRRGRKFFLS